ncbi:MAG: hypothetical protein LAT54_09755 [Cryomorphaceae bacterium]|nr:hypothetical protein [Cryomorphaceae bacterium]
MSLSKAKEKRIKRLHNKKHRYNDRLFIAEGNKLVKDLIDIGFEPEELFVHDESDALLFSNAERIELAERKRITTLDNPAGAMAVFPMPKTKTIDHIKSSCLALYGVQDPGNLGTIIRTASWFGHQQILLMNGCVDPFNPKTIQASMGALAHIDIIQGEVNDLQRLQEKGFICFLADMHGDDAFNVDWPEKWLMILGSEGQGLKGLSTAGRKISIPRFGAIGPESLNVAVAASVLMTLQAKKMRP